MSLSPFVVAIDGPAGAGKSTVAKQVAQKLQFTFVDTGALYRAVALQALEQNVPWSDEAQLSHIAQSLNIQFQTLNDRFCVFLHNRDVTDAIRTPLVSQGSSQVSALPGVRAGLLHLQRHLAGTTQAVLEGRDIGTVVYPQAQVKIFLDASCEERARRRCAELQAKGVPAVYQEVLLDIQTRDAQDRNRPIAPLKPAVDAILLDSTGMSSDHVVDRIVQIVRERMQMLSR